MRDEPLTRAEALALGVACGAIDASRLMPRDRALLEQGVAAASKGSPDPLVALLGKPIEPGEQLTEAHLLAAREHLSIASRDALELAAHCARLGHDYEIEGGVVACGRCGAPL
jgi:hypothetical protein